MAKRTLHAVTATFKGVKAGNYAQVTALFKEAQKAEPYQGFAKTFSKKNEADEDFAPESKKVVLIAGDVLAKVAKLEAEVFNLAAQQDWANAGAAADIIVDGTVLYRAVPVTYLLFAEKPFIDMRDFINKMPVLDENRDWTTDPNSKLCRTDPTITSKTRKVQRPIVKYDATPQHPAQTEMISEDVTVGWWKTTHLSGAIPAPRKELLLERIDKLIQAIREARERANDREVEEHPIGTAFFAYLLAP